MSREEMKSAESAAANPKAKANGQDRKATGAEILEAMAEEVAAPTAPKASAGHFFRDVVIVSALLAAGAYFYNARVKTKEQVGKLQVAAAEKVEKDDLEALKDAEAKYQEILKLDASSAVGFSGLAETYFLEWKHGLDTKGQAEDSLRKAGNVERPERYAVDAYLKVAAGDPATAERDIKALLDRGIYHPKLATAYGSALIAQDRFPEANQALSRALETSFGAVRIILLLAEGAHRSGDERAAARHLERTTGNGMNNQHEIALAWLAALRIKNSGALQSPVRWLGTAKERDQKGLVGPVAKAHIAWAEGELALAMGNLDTALERAEAALAANKNFPPYYDLKARVLASQGKNTEAYAAYDAGIAIKPAYRGLRLELAKLKSENKDDGALALIDELEKEKTGQKGPDFELLRGNHYLRTGKLGEAKAAFTRAADLGDDPQILLGLAKVSFEEEKKKGKKANLDAVAENFQKALEARAVFPELNDAMGYVNLWNFQGEAAGKSFEDAEGQYKKVNRPVRELVKFYDRVIATLENSKEKEVQKDTQKLIPIWKKKKQDYLASVGSLSN